jgi:hypothetical protein
MGRVPKQNDCKSQAVLTIRLLLDGSSEFLLFFYVNLNQSFYKRSQLIGVGLLTDIVMRTKITHFSLTLKVNSNQLIGQGLT